MPENYYSSSVGLPFHLSVGAMLIDENNKLVCHYFKDLSRLRIKEKDLYVCMTETPEIGETLEEALHRGLLEEFGATGEIAHFLGSQVAAYTSKYAFEDYRSAEKTIVWFLVTLKTLDESKRDKESVEGSSEICRLSLSEAVDIFEKQFERLDREDLNHRKILERVKDVLDSE